MPGQPRAAIIPVTPIQQNCTLLWDESSKRAAVIDPGGDIALIEAAIAKHGVKVESILLTHGHFDHAGGAAELAQRLGNLPVEGPHRGDEPLLQRQTEAALSFGIEGAKPVTPDRWLDEGDEVGVGPLSFTIRHCPGHSPGSVVYISRDLPFALVGDVLFRGSVGRTDLPGGDHETLLASIRDKLLPLPDETAFICGHGPTSTIGHERRTNPFLI